MHRKKDSKGMILVKVDLEKAYDRLRWSFIHDTLKAMHLSPDFRNLIMMYHLLFHANSLEWETFFPDTSRVFSLYFCVVYGAAFAIDLGSREGQGMETGESF